MCAEQSFPGPANAEALCLQLKLRKACTSPTRMIVGRFQAGPLPCSQVSFCSVNCRDFEHSGHLYHVSRTESAAGIVVLYCRGNEEVCYSLN